MRLLKNYYNYAKSITIVLSAEKRLNNYISMSIQLLIIGFGVAGSARNVMKELLNTDGYVFDFVCNFLVDACASLRIFR